MGIGDCLTLALHARGLTQKSLADRTGLSTNYINMIVKNTKVPTLVTLQKICNALDISLSGFFLPMDGEGSEEGLSLTSEEKQLIYDVRILKANEKDAVYSMVSALKGKAKTRAKLSESKTGETKKIAKSS